MKNHEIFSLVISFLAILVSIYAIIISKKANSISSDAIDEAKKANSTSSDALDEAKKANSTSSNALDEAKKANSISSNALDEAKKANSTAFGQLEFVISERITATQDKVTERLDLLVPFISKKNEGTLSAEETALFEHHKKALKTAIASNINVYEQACTTYLDNKIDTDRFKKSYFSSIRQLVENEEYKNHFHPTTTKYKAILKVYKEWYDLEK